MQEFVEDESFFDVRSEAWYFGYLNANVKTINSLCAKKSFQSSPDGNIKLLGIKGDVTFGKRTLAEWTCLSRDLDRGVKEGSVNFRPDTQRIGFEHLAEELQWVERGQPGAVRHIVIASVPARIGEDREIMQKVKELASEYDNVHMTFSQAGDLVDTIFKKVEKATLKTCKNGHPLYPVGIPGDGWACDARKDAGCVCQNKVKNEWRWHCGPCNYDLCEPCMGPTVSSFPKCKNNHRLVYRGIPNRYWFCDRRDEGKCVIDNKVEQVESFHCSACNYDMCKPCVAAVCSSNGVELK